MPVAGVGWFIGLNHADQGTEAHLSLPSEPIVFLETIASLANASRSCARDGTYPLARRKPGTLAASGRLCFDILSDDAAAGGGKVSLDY